MTGPASPQLRLDLPAGFAAIHLNSSGRGSSGPGSSGPELSGTSFDAQARRLVAGLRVAGRPVADAEQTVRSVAATLTLFASLNVQLLGTFAVRTPEGPATATVVLAVHPLPLADPGAAAANLPGLAGAVREVVRRRHPVAETRVVTLPIGPTVVGVWFGELRLPAERTGTAHTGTAHTGTAHHGVAGEGPVATTHRVQFLIPLPAAELLVALDVSTVSEQGWPAVARQAVSIASSVRFDHAG